MMNKRKLRAAFTIEMSILVPVILFVIMGLITSVFYFHDKNILNGAASETAVVGSMKLRDNEQIDEAELIDFCRERLKGKCIYLVSHNIDISIEKEEVIVQISARKNRFSVSVMKRSAITEPEKRIRDVRRLGI